MVKPFDILLIEDDPDDAELTLHALKKNNLVNALHHIDDGEEALEFLFDDRHPLPKIILLDLRMPRVDGVTILQRLKADPVRKAIPVIAMISSQQGITYVESHQVKADAYLFKPVEFKKFMSIAAELGLSWTIVKSHVE